MPFDLNNAPLLVANPPPSVAMETPAQMAVGRQVIQDIKQRAIEQAQDQQAQDAFRTQLQQNGGDYDAALTAMDKQGYNTLKLKGAVADYRKKLQENAKSRLDQMKLQSDMLDHIVPNITDQNSLDAYAPLVKQIDPEFAAQMGSIYDPQKFAAFKNFGLTAKDMLDEGRKSIDAYAKGDAQQGLGRAISITTDDNDLAGAIQYAKAHGTPDYMINALVPPGTKWSPDLVVRAKQLVADQGKPAAEKAIQKIAGMYHGKQTYGDFDPNDGSITVDGKKVSGEEFRPIPSAAMVKLSMPAMPGKSGGLTPEGVDYAATLYRLGKPLPALGMGAREEKDAIINKAAEQTKAIGLTPAAMFQRQAMLKADQGSLNQMQKQRDATSGFEDKLMPQLDLIDSLSDKVSRTKWPIINAALLAGKREIAGDPDASALLNAIVTGTDEYAKIINGGVGSVQANSDSARKQANRLLDAAMNKGQIRRLTQQMRTEAGFTMDGYEAVLKDIGDRMGGLAGSSPSPAGATPTTPQSLIGPNDVQAPTGKIYHFSTKAQADAFRKAAGL